MVVFIVQHHVRPIEVEHGHISQVDDAVGIAIDIVTVVVQVVERNVIECAEYQTQDAVDNGCSDIGVPSYRNRGANPYPGSGTIRACGRGKRTSPVVMHVVQSELITVVVLLVVIGMLRIVTVIPSVIMRLATAMIGLTATMIRLATSVAGLAAVVGLAATITGLAAVAGLATSVTRLFTKVGLGGKRGALFA